MTVTHFLSYVFHLLPFLGLILFLMTYILFDIKLGKTGVYNKPRFLRYYLWAGVAAILTQWCYVYAPPRIFTNSDHHVLEQLGFAFDQRLTLIDQNRPQTALWDDKPGQLQLDYQIDSGHFRLHGRGFAEPIYTEIAPKVYRLQNPLLPQPIRHQLRVELDSVALDFSLQFDVDTASSFRVIQGGRTYGPFQVPLPMPLKKGYSLGKMLARTRADAPGIGDLVAVLDSVYLLRQRIFLNEDDMPQRDTVLLFPSTRLMQSNARILIDNQEFNIQNQVTCDVTLTPRQGVFFGLWSSQKPVYSANRGPFGSAWVTRSPHREYLKRLDNDGESLFLTSSATEVTRSEQMAGFYFPLFGNEANRNHLSANLFYHTGSTREAMQFRVINYDQDDLSNQGIRHYQAGDTLLLPSRGMSHGLNQTQWLFRIRDLKATNPLQFWHMLLLTLLIVGSIWSCLLLTPYERQTKAEYILYMLVLALMTVRSILLWRASTFLPLEDATPDEFNFLSKLGLASFREGAGACLAFFGLVALWKLGTIRITAWGSHLMNRLSPRPSGEALSPWLLVGLGLYVPAIGLKLIGGSAERIGSIYFPLLVYFGLEFWYLRVLVNAGRDTIKDPDYRRLSVLNWLLCLAFLGLSDAGFSIIFLVATLIYQIILELTFPRPKTVTAEQEVINRTVWAFLWAVVLGLFLWLSPYLVSCLFLYTPLFLYLLAGGVLVYAGWAAWRGRVPVFFGHKPSRWTVPLVCLVVAIGLAIGNGALNKVVQKKVYTRYRAEVLIRTPDEIMQNEEFRFSTGRDSELLRAAQNQWLINHFYQKGSINPQHYFRILPSFKKGSSYLTQICDLVTVRYVIAEHSQFVITFLLGLMIILILATTDADTPFNRFSVLRVRMLCLLFASGFFVWMAATNRMVFLGQDFPMLSLNSRLTWLFTFTILLWVIIWGDRASLTSSSVEFIEPGKERANSIIRTLMLGAIFVLPLVREHRFSEEQFNLEATISRLTNAFDELNREFLAFQDDTPQARQWGPNQLIQRFDASSLSPRQNKALLDSNRFARSAYDAYIVRLATGQNSPENLVHLRRRNDNRYEFAVNRLYYNVTSPDVTLNAWRGHLLAEQRSQDALFVNRQNQNRYTLDTHQADADLDNAMAGLFNQTANNNIRLTSLPAGWSADSLPIVLASRDEGKRQTNQASFVVKSGPDLYDSRGSAYAVVLRPNDVVQFQPRDERRTATLQFQYQPRQYLAKNVWLNGHQQFFYPMGHKLLWSYHFANLAKSKFEHEKAASQQSVTLSLDPRLNEQLYDEADRYFRAAKWDAKTERARALNLVVLGSDGKLRALTSFQKGASVRIDPNRLNRYNDLLTDLYLNAQTNEERLLFGNRCLMRMDNGPASTFKPILYSAVTSQYRFDWEGLEFGGLNPTVQPGFLEQNGRDYQVRRFGGDPVRFTIGNNNLPPHDLDYYIGQSTNTYNSMMVYLGSLTPDQLQHEREVFLVRGRAAQPERNFPLLRINGTDYHIGSMQIDWSNQQSLLGQGLWFNYDLPIRKANQQRAIPRQNLARGLDSTVFDNSMSSNKVWSFPEPSHLYLIDRNNTHNAIVQCATGADPINVTPYKMAEMAASLFSFNKEFRGSVLASHQNLYQPLNAHSSWERASNLSQFYSNTLFRAMQHATETGTSADLLRPIRAEFGQYHFYAKTGTISGDRKNGGKRDKHLMLIISREPVHERNLTPEALRNNRFMVLYFSFYKESSEEAEWGDAGETLRNMVRAVIESDSFQTLMHNETNH
ncbi:hypothetical protein [Spirosoma fluviale]|uniref:Uncharacterized protein n=1 Tax=Spirosoma fluviale TaxID=1597977 RepID=A0A286GLL1_9BACT|nr:hypothetical protein [Spirosoma fluviale]SOD96433.1 hypothetical protein SAMN06269250_5307 [Spirosoma fluviale]